MTEKQKKGVSLPFSLIYWVFELMKQNELKKKASLPSTEQVIEDSSSEEITKKDKFERWRKEALATLETQTPVLPTTEIIEPLFSTKEDKNKKTL